MRGWVVLLALLLLPTYGAESSSIEGEFHEVAFFDLTCLEEGGCQAQTPNHFIEYHASETCEPCVVVEEMFSERQDDASDVLVIEHRPSPQDSEFLSESKVRFEQVHRLYGIPNLVIDGKGLLSGSSQALELEQALANHSSLNESVLNYQLNAGNLTWTPAEGRIQIIETRDDALHNVTAITEVNASLGSYQINATEGLLVLIHETPGRYQLEYWSESIASGLEFEDEDMKTESMDRSGLAITVGIALIFLVIPAFVMTWNIMKTPFPAEEE